MAQQKDDYDSPWKGAIETYFQEFMAFFFPEAHDDIDWTKGHEFLDKELAQVMRGAQIGRRLADKLVKVFRKGGDETWLMIHVEVQGQEVADFAERMYVYNYRIFDQRHCLVVSFAVLADERSTWRPDQFGYRLWGCRVQFEFPVVKLLDYGERWAELEESLNPFATVVMAHLKAQETRQDPNARLEWKFSLVKRLYERGYDREDILKLFRFIDWLLALPEELEDDFDQALAEYEEDRKMPYVTSVERAGIRKAIRGAVIDVLEVRFQDVPESIIEAVNGIYDPSVLKALLREAATAASLAEWEQALGECV